MCGVGNGVGGRGVFIFFIYSFVYLFFLRPISYNSDAHQECDKTRNFVHGEAFEVSLQHAKYTDFKTRSCKDTQNLLRMFKLLIFLSMSPKLCFRQ